MDTGNNQTASAENDVTEVELNAARQLFATLLLTAKNLSLYPQGHTVFLKSINQLYIQLSEFLKKYGTFKLEIERERLAYRGKTIHEGKPEEGSLHYTLFRDGLRWLELMDGIEQLELADILILINKYTKLSAEPEGDIVTAFWETGFPHMKYEVVEILWEGEPGAEKFSELISENSKAARPAEPGMREKEYDSDPPIDMNAVILTPEEETALQEMIRMEEDTERTSYLDALLDSLLQHREENNFNNILDALSEEFTLSLGRKDFVVTLKILQGLQYVRNICREELPWAGKQIDDFILKASSEESLMPLKDTWEQTDPEEAAVLKDIFMLLDPKAVRMLISTLSQSQPALLRKVLLDLIILLASKDTRSLELALNNSSEDLLKKLVSVIAGINGGQSLKYLLKLSHHPSGYVRYEAIKGILAQEPARLKDMLDLIDDSEDSIGQLVLEKMGQARDENVERFLISYLRKNRSGSINSNHVIRCFRTLGKCGSIHSVPFLTKTLLKWRFLPGSGRAVKRRGAAVALGELGIVEADEVLERASRSLFPSVRGIAGKVRLEMQEEAVNSGR